MKKNLLIRNGNIAIGGQEKMLVELLNNLNPEKYNIRLLVEENKGEQNDYLSLIPKWIDIRFLTTENFMKKILNYKKSKNLFKKLYFSYLLKKKKYVAAEEFKKHLDFSDTIIDYDMGLLRNLHTLSLENKTLIGWSHAGDGSPPSSKIKAKNMEKYDYIVAINSVMENGLKKFTSHPIIKKIYNFMDFDEIKKKSENSIELNFTDYIVSVGSLTENKNQIMLIKAFLNLKKKYNIKEKLLLIGDGKEKISLERFIKDNHLENEVFLLGQKQNPYPYIKNAKLYVMTSMNEGLPLTLLESLILNKMIISTKNSGSVEILGENSKYGKLLRENSVEELEKELFFYLNNPIEIEKYENLASERVCDFSKSRAQEIIEDFIDNL